MSKHSYSTPGNVLFLTGTDTGVGKTVLTSLLVTHLTAARRHVLAIKPFCSGGRADAEILYEAQQRRLPIADICPFYFQAAVAPLVAARECGRRIFLAEVLEKVTTMAGGCGRLLVEGAGGLLAPLGERYTAVEMIVWLRCPVIVVAANRLGTVNHVLLTLAALRRLPVPECKVVLMGVAKPDRSAPSNAALIRQFAPEEVFVVPYLGPRATSPDVLKKSAEKLKKTLAAIARVHTLSTLRRDGEGGKDEGRRRRKKGNNSLAGAGEKGKLFTAFPSKLRD